MPKLSSFQPADVTQKVVIGEGDSALTAVVYPNLVNQARADALRALDDDQKEERADLFFSIFKEWDLLDDETGLPLPFSADTLDLLSIPTTVGIMQEIMDAILPDPKSSKKRRGG